MLRSGIGRRGPVVGLLLTALLALTLVAPGAALADAGDHTRDEAVAYLNSLVGEECCWNDSTTDCVDVAQYYYDWLGVGARSGNGCAYHTGNLPGGWERVYSDPEPGDVAAWGADWGSSGYGHVACVVGVDGGTVTVVEQSTTKRKQAGHNIACYYATYSVSSPYSYLRPNFREPVNHDPIMMVDGCSGGVGTLSVSGWAFDPDEPDSSLWINVYVGAPYGDPATWGHGDIRADLESADVNSAYGVGGAHRFAATFDVPMEGDQPVYVYALNVGEGTHRVYGPIDVRIEKRHDPIMMVDGCSGGVGTLSVSGWAFDPDEPDSSLWINVYVGAPYGDPATWGHGDIRADLESADVNSAYGVGGAHRFAATFDVPMEGDQPVYVYALNVGEGTHRVYGPIDVRIEKRHGDVSEGWVDLLGGKKGYVKNGKLVTGWRDIDGSKYYFLPDGSMATGWTDVVADGKTYHYYFNPASGNLVRNTWFQIDGKTYYFRPSGNLATGWATISDNGVDKKYYLDESGQLVTGWRDIDNGQGQVNRYYFRPSGSMATGWATIDGQKYWFRPSGNMATGFTTVDDAYKRYFDGEGHMLVGWQVIDGKTFYFRASGAMQTGEATIDGKTYTFTANGTLTSGTLPAQSDDDEILVVGQDDSDALDDAFDGGVFDEDVVLL